MAITNNERIKKTLDLMREGLQPFVERRLKAAWGPHWRSRLRQWGNDVDGHNEDPIPWDSHLLLKVLCFLWDQAFRTELGQDIRTTARALLDVRNRYAHERSFDSHDTLRALGESRKLLISVNARKQVSEAVNLHDELMRTMVASRNRQPKVRTTDIRFGTTAGEPWRSIVVPHTDVLSNTFTEAEFAADLGQVVRGVARPEYGNPQEFFNRTYLSEGLKALLTTAAHRFAGRGGAPVVDLQTGFGGGKTHSMLALYHMSGEGAESKNLSGVDDLLREIGLVDLPRVNRAVIVGTLRGPSEPIFKEDGTVINTIWGDIAWQLGGRAGFDLVAAADRDGTAPGSRTLSELLKTTSPCLILIDEWVAFIRQLYRINERLPAGNFDANLTFAQSLTEAVRSVPNAILVASLPQSQTEIGGEGGNSALQRLQSTFGRMERPWRPATSDESFEIVRRRLFEPISTEKLRAGRDRTIQAFCQFYRAAKTDFPQECSEKSYESRMAQAYPIHPLLFDQLYQVWGSLDGFQKTRGVLRMVAAIVRVLWETSHEGRLILPAFVPLNDGTVLAEVKKSLDRNWDSVLATDVDGSNSVPRRIDNEMANLGRYSATCRVARCVFMATAPTFETGIQPGIDKKSINLGSTQPGEVHRSFGDALRHLSGRSTYLYEEGARVWFATKASVNKLAEERAEIVTNEDIEKKIIKQLQRGVGRGDFCAVHIAPKQSTDVPDEDRARLVVLGPQSDRLFAPGKQNPAEQTCREILLHRDEKQRRFRNTLVFLAADEARMGGLKSAIQSLLAWESIVNDYEILDLDAQQKRLAEQRKSEFQTNVHSLILETWSRVLVPYETDAAGNVSWHIVPVRGSDSLADRVSRRLVQDEQLLLTLGPIRLAMYLNDHDLWREQDHVLVQRVWEDMCTFLYLPRLKDSNVLINAVKSAVERLANDELATARRWNEDEQEYEDLSIEGQSEVSIVLDGECILVKIDVAKDVVGPIDPDPDPNPDPDPDPVYSRFFGSMEADPERLKRDVGKIADDVISHLNSVPDSTVTVTLEIHANAAQGFQEEIRRTVGENCSELDFKTSGFEES